MLGYVSFLNLRVLRFLLLFPGEARVRRQGRAGRAAGWLVGRFTPPPSGPTRRVAGRSVVVCRRPAAAAPRPAPRSVYPPSHSYRPVRIWLKGRTVRYIPVTWVSISVACLSLCITLCVV